MECGQWSLIVDQWSCLLTWMIWPNDYDITDIPYGMQILRSRKMEAYSLCCLRYEIAQRSEQSTVQKQFKLHMKLRFIYFAITEILFDSEEVICWLIWYIYYCVTYTHTRTYILVFCDAWNESSEVQYSCYWFNLRTTLLYYSYFSS